MKSKREEFKKITKQTIYDVAVKLFREQGVENTPVSQITLEVGIAKGTFFRYYQTKDHLVLAFYRNMFNKLIDKIKKINYVNAYEAFMDLGIKTAELIISEKKLFLYHGRSTIINKEIAEEEKTLTKELAEYCLGVMNKFNILLEDDDKLMFIEIYNSILTASYNDWKISEGYTDLPEVVKKRTGFLYKAIIENNSSPE